MANTRGWQEGGPDGDPEEDLSGVVPRLKVGDSMPESFPRRRLTKPQTAFRAARFGDQEVASTLGMGSDLRTTPLEQRVANAARMNDIRNEYLGHSSVMNVVEPETVYEVQQQTLFE